MDYFSRDRVLGRAKLTRTSRLVATELFKVKYNKEVAVQDVKHANVFLFDGKLLDENSQEFYYEEFCYKQFKVKEHHSDVKKESLGVVARRQLGGIGGVSSGSFEGVGVGSGIGAGGAFDSGSFLSGYDGLDGGQSFPSRSSRSSREREQS